jgi:D-Tyr-tRNAtyr deacylase
MIAAGNIETYPSSVSQFTLLASTKKGNKPDFHGALGGEQAKELYQVFFSKIQEGYKPERVKDGVFQATMVNFANGKSLTKLLN